MGVFVAAQPYPQIKLPLQHEGVGLCTIVSIKAEAALLLGATTVRANLAESLPLCRHFDSMMRPTLLAAWHLVLDDAGGECSLGPLTRDLPADFVAETLPSMSQM